VFVPAERLVAGDNVLAVETHVNYRKAKSVSMQARVERVERPAHGIHEYLSRTGDVRTLADLDHAVLL